MITRPWFLVVLVVLAIVAGCVRPVPPNDPVDWRPPLAGGLLVASAALDAGANIAGERGDVESACAQRVTAAVVASGAHAVLSAGERPELGAQTVELGPCLMLDVDVPDVLDRLDQGIVRGLELLRAQLRAYVRDCEARAWLDLVVLRLQDAVTPLLGALLGRASSLELPARSGEACP